LKKRISRPTKAMRDAGYRALHAIVADPDAGDTARVSAARALIRDDPEQKAAEDAAAIASRGPRAVLCLPDNGRSPPGVDPLGINRGDGAITIIYDGNTPEGLADRDRWLAEIEAEREAEFPTKTPLMLAPPIAKPKLTEAERKRAYRARLKAAKAAA
jgi:hypothetical protein